MEQFKRSVLDEHGRVRRMNDRQAMEVANAAADGMLKQVSQAPAAVFTLHKVVHLI